MGGADAGGADAGGGGGGGGGSIHLPCISHCNLLLVYSIAPLLDISLYVYSSVLLILPMYGGGGGHAGLTDCAEQLLHVCVGARRQLHEHYLLLIGVHLHFLRRQQAGGASADATKTMHSVVFLLPPARRCSPSCSLLSHGHTRIHTPHNHTRQRNVLHGAF